MKILSIGIALSVFAFAAAPAAFAQQHVPKKLVGYCHEKAGAVWSESGRRYIGGNEAVFQACLGGRDKNDAAPGARLLSCRAVYDRCVKSSDPKYVGGCGAYYDTAKQTGKWPSFGGRAAFPCGK